MKAVIFIPLLSVSVTLFAQEKKLHADQQSLVEAEWSFIRMAKDKNTRDAFLANFTDETIVFNGATPVNAKKQYETIPVNDSWLKWEPVYTDIAASGDFGYNTGPWEFRVKKTDEKAVAFGHFVSVWKKYDGQWKLAIDVGVNHPEPSAAPPALSNSKIKTKGKKRTDSDVMELIKLEKQFIAEHAASASNAYAQYLSTEARIYRSGYQPFVAAEQAKQGVQQVVASSYSVENGDLASTGDLAFVYGAASVKISESENKDAGYTRIWKREGGNRWKIVVDVLTFR